MLNIDGSQIACSVLSDGTRLLTQEGFLSALGRSAKPKGRSQQATDGLPPFLATKSLTALISPEIIDATVPIVFITPGGGKALGYKAELLPKVCDLFLQARSLGLLTTQQLPIAEKAEMLVRALAKVGIVALVRFARPHPAASSPYEDQQELGSLQKESRNCFPSKRISTIFRFR